MVLTGDLNTEDANDLAQMDAIFAEVDLERVSIVTDKGKDHIYYRDLVLESFGEETDLTELSDHPAVWAEFKWD